MKRWIRFFGHLVIVVVLTGFGTNTIKNTEKVQVPQNLKTTEEVLSYDRPLNLGVTVLSAIETPVFLGKNFIGFKEAMGFKESQGKYGVINTLGYMGKYQFGSGTLKLMGVYNTKQFIGNAKLQEQVFDLNVARNKWILRRDIKRFVGKRINGVVISESGMIAAAHLAGAGNVKKYLRSYGKMDFSDAYGSTVAYYMKRFSGFDISSVQAKHNPKV